MKIDILSEDDVLRFRLSGVDKSFANALRRTLIGNIPILVFKPEDCVIEVNTSRFTHEIIASRLGGIPIHDKDISNSYTITVSEKNTGSSMLYVTTDKFKVKKNGDAVSSHTIFKPDPVTKQYIDFLRLRENVVVSGEELVLTCKSSVGTATECGNYNAVSTCSYANTIDIDASESAYLGTGKNKQDWDLLDAKRYFIKDSFDFVLESVGIYTPRELLLLASIILREQLAYLSSSAYEIEPSMTTIDNCFDVKITGSYNHKDKVIEMTGDYSIGKLLEYNLYTKFESLTYITFEKKHPHDTSGFLRIAFPGATLESVRTKITESCQEVTALCEKFSALVENV
jgi:DNA-directed RNA polymerase subunit L